MRYLFAVVPLDELVPKLIAIWSARNDDELIFVRCNRRVNYGSMLAVMGKLIGAGVKRLAFVNDPPDAPRPN